MLEGLAPPDALVEKRYERTHDGVVISGGVDSLRVVRQGKVQLLRDWKSTKDLPKYSSPYSNHLKQVNVYRWLLDLDPKTVEIEVVYVSMEGVKILRLKKGGETRTGRKIPEQVWPDEKVEEFLSERLALLAREDLLPYSDVPAADLWNCDYCPIRDLCHRKGYQENLARMRAGVEEGRVPPRQKEVKR
jgi:hypothetical protein